MKILNTGFRPWGEVVHPRRDDTRTISRHEGSLRMRPAGLFLSVAALTAAIFSGCLSDESSSKSIDGAARLGGTAPAVYAPEVAARLLAHTGLGLDLDPPPASSRCPRSSPTSA